MYIYYKEMVMTVGTTTSMMPNLHVLHITTTSILYHDQTSWWWYNSIVTSTYIETLIHETLEEEEEEGRKKERSMVHRDGDGGCRWLRSMVVMGFVLSLCHTPTLITTHLPTLFFFSILSFFLSFGRSRATFDKLQMSARPTTRSPIY